MTSMLLVVNPSAGAGRARAALPGVVRGLRAGGWQVRVRLTCDLDDAEGVAACVPRGSVVGALGGDGLLSRVAGGVRAASAVLAPLPGGRGNDFCAYLGVERNPVAAAAALSAAAARHVDVAEVAGRTVLGVASCGFDAEASRRANGFRVLRGRTVYAAAALRTLATWQPAQLTVTVDGDRREVSGYTVAVANSGRYGGGMRIAPDASVDDGLLDVVTVSRMPRHEFARSLPGVFRGTHVDHPAVDVRRGREVTVASSQPLTVYADGEEVAGLPCTVRAFPAALSVLVG